MSSNHQEYLKTMITEAVELKEELHKKDWTYRWSYIIFSFEISSYYKFLKP